MDVAHNVNQAILPHAKSEIVLWYKDEDGEEDSVTLIEVEFRAETEEEVKQQVEAWAQEQMNKVVQAVKLAFDKVK